MTTASPGWPDLSPADIRGLAPAAIASFDVVLAAVGAAVDPRLLELVRLRISTLLGAATGPASAAAELPGGQVLSAADQLCLEFAEQFVLDVSGVTDTDRAALGDALGNRMFGFVQALYVLDHGLRLRVVVRQLLGNDPFESAVDSGGLQLWPALEAMMTEVVCLRALDPLSSELIRLRGAAAHNCRLCQSLRSVAVVAEHGEALEQVNDYELADIGDAQRAALRLTDAILWRPVALPTAVVASVRTHFSPAAALEIALDVVRNASNKIAVALGADDPHVAAGVEYYDVTDTGEYRYGLPAPA